MHTLSTITQKLSKFWVDFTFQDLTSTIASNGRHTTAGVVGAYAFKNATFRVGVDKDSKVGLGYTSNILF